MADQLDGAGAKTVDGFDFAGMQLRDGRFVEELPDVATLLEEGTPNRAHVLGMSLL